MKKLFKVVISVVLLFSFTACGSSETSDFDPIEVFGTDVLNVYNWGEYIGDDVISGFEEKYNVKVNYSLFSSNEEMYTKLMSGSSYDVIIPSDYMIDRLIEEDMLQEIDKSIVVSLDVLTEGVTNLDFDSDNTYAVPYLWGTVGIVYDSTKVDSSEVESLGWSIFQDSTYSGHVYMYDSERDAFMIALKALGYSMNTEDLDEINEAYEWLRVMDANVSPSYVTDEVIDGMVNSEKWIALVYSGDAAYILSQNEDMRYYEPTEGTNIWVDCMVIPENASNPIGANYFIEYCLSYDASYSTSDYVGYTSSNAEVLEDLSSEDGTYYENEAYIPRSDYELDEIYLNLDEEVRQTISELWVKVKLHS